MNTNENCQTCNDLTKYVIGLWDGPNGTHGAIFDCHNLECEIKRSRKAMDEYREEVKKDVVKVNESNNIFVDSIKLKRKELQITISKMAKSLGVSPSDYSDYETCRIALSVEMVGRINEVFRGVDK